MKPLDDLSGDEFERLLHKAVGLPDAPPNVLRAAIALFPTEQPRQAPLLQTVAQAALRQLAAVLSFDSWAVAPMAAGMRALRSETRHLLFSVPGRDVDLRIAPAAEHFVLTGQVLGPDESGQIELRRLPADGPDNAAPALTALDALGEFRLPAVRAGTYVLTLRLGGDEIVLPPIDVGEQGR